MNRLLGIGAVAAVVVGFLSFKKVDFKLAAEDSNIVVTDRHTGKRWKVVGQKNEGTPLWSKATLTGNVRQNAATYTFGDYGAGWYDRLLKGERQPRHQPPPKLTEEELWTEIWELYVGLYDSPENLYEDGEASPSRVKEKIATFKRKIRMAGKELGRKVSYEQANDWARKNNIGWYGNAEDDNFKLAAEGETDVEQTLSMLGLTVAEVVEQNIAYKSKKSYGTAQVVIDKHTGELYHRIYDKGAGSLGREDYLHNSYGAYASQLKNFNKWVRLINSHSRGGSSGPGGRCVFIVSLLINRETGEVLRSHQGVESKNAESFSAEYRTPRYYKTKASIRFLEREKEQILEQMDAIIKRYVGYRDEEKNKEDKAFTQQDINDIRAIKREIKKSNWDEARFMCANLDSGVRDWMPDELWQAEEEYDEEYYAESKKLPPLEKAEITGIASGATMEGLETLLAAESFSAEEPSVYYWVKEEMVKRLPLTDADIDNLLEMIRKSVPLPEIEEGMNQARNLGDEAIWFILSMAQTTRSGDLTIQERFVERYQADFPTTKKPNCKCGAILEWDNLRKAWYCISCPFNTYKAEMDEKAIICPHCEDAEATEICEWCKGKECKECFEEHMTDCNYCEGEGEIPRSWVSDSGDRWSPSSLDVTDWEMCEYCNEGQVCGDEYIPEFSWDAESLSPEDGIKYVGWQKPAPTHFGYYMSSLHATEPPYETTLCGVKLSGEKEIFYIDNPHPHGSRCSKCQKSVDKRKTDFQSESFSAEGDRCYKCKTTQGKMYWHGKKGLICAICSEGGVKYRSESFEAKGGYERKEKSIYHECFECGYKTEPKWMVRQQDRKCPKCKDEDWQPVQTMIGKEDMEATDARRKKEKLEKIRKVFEESGLADWEEEWEKWNQRRRDDRKKMYGAESFIEYDDYEGLYCRNCATTEVRHFAYIKDKNLCIDCSEGRIAMGAESFSAESDGDKQLDESKKRTKMSAIRTGLAITTFSIVMWNLWTNKKQQKDIADIMALV